MACRLPSWLTRALQNSEETSLTYAAAEGHTDIVRFLLESGATIEWPRKVRFCLSRFRWLSAESMLAQQADKQTALCRASSQGRLDTVRELLKHGANPNHQDLVSMPLDLVSAFVTPAA